MAFSPEVRSDDSHRVDSPRRRVLKCAAFAGLLGWLLTAAGLVQAVVYAQAAVAPRCPVDMRLLVMSADGTEPVLTAIRQTLDYLGTPYRVYVATRQPGGLNASVLSQGCHGFYQGVVLTTGELGYFSPAGVWTSALSPAEFETLRQYEAAFDIRQVTWYTFPTPAFGFNWGTAVDTTTQPVDGSFTPDGAAVFPYLNTSNHLTIRNVYAYLAQPLDTGTTPLLVDAAGHALAAVRTFPDGRENLALTFDSNQYLVHAIALGYGVINWVTRGIFIGERHVYMSAQVDDLLIADSHWYSSLLCSTPVADTGVALRITGSDLQNVVNWQTNLQTSALTADVQLSLAFNGVGATGIYQPDDLTPAVKKNRINNSFFWISHTFTHANLDNLTYDLASQELLENIRQARTLGFTKPQFDRQNLVTPEVSGLLNPMALQAAFDAGVRYVVSDTSRPGYGNPSPNIGIVNPLQPQILEIPRRPNNLFFNVATPDDWVAEYNCRYQGFWGRALSYQEILEIESDTLLGYLLRGDADPWMFHQTNLAAYDSVHTLLTNLLDLTLTKYRALYTLPILSPPMNEIGELMRARQGFNDEAPTAILFPGYGIAILPPATAVTVPITGVNAFPAEMYGGQFITHVDVKPGRFAIVPLRSIPR